MPYDFRNVTDKDGEFIVALKQNSGAHMSAVPDSFVDADEWSGLCFSYAVVWLQFLLKVTNNTSAIDFTNCIKNDFKNSHLLTSLQEQLLTKFSYDRVRSLISRIICVPDRNLTKSGSYDEEEYTWKDYSRNIVKTRTNIAKSCNEYYSILRSSA